MSAKLVHAREHEETIARHRSLLANEMFATMAKLVAESDQDSAESVTFDWFCLFRVAGSKVAEYAQTTQSKVDEHKYAYGNKVVKSWIASDWTFYDE
jgi:hypothetical protein